MRAPVVGLVETLTETNEEGTEVSRDAIVCSAVKLSPEFLLTAAHCITSEFDQETQTKKTIGVEVRYYDEYVDRMVRTGVVAKFDDDIDLALIRVHTVCPCAPLASSDPKVDEQVYAVGYPLGPDTNGIQTLTEGRWQGNIDDQFQLTSAFVIFGNSGGALYNSRGELIGIVQQIMSHGDGMFSPFTLVGEMSLSARLDVIKRFADGF